MTSAVKRRKTRTQTKEKWVKGAGKGGGAGKAVVNFCCFALFVPRTKVQQTMYAPPKRRRHGSHLVVWVYECVLCVCVLCSHTHTEAKNEIGLQSKQETGPGFGDMAIDTCRYRYGCTKCLCAHGWSTVKALEKHSKFYYFLGSPRKSTLRKSLIQSNKYWRTTRKGL